MFGQLDTVNENLVGTLSFKRAHGMNRITNKSQPRARLASGQRKSRIHRLSVVDWSRQAERRVGFFNQPRDGVVPMAASLAQLGKKQRRVGGKGLGFFQGGGKRQLPHGHVLRKASKVLVAQRIASGVGNGQGEGHDKQAGVAIQRLEAPFVQQRVPSAGRNAIDHHQVQKIERPRQAGKLVAEILVLHQQSCDG